MRQSLPLDQEDRFIKATQSSLDRISKDVKAWDKLEENRKAQMIGATAVSGVSSWYTSRFIASRMITRRPGLVRGIAGGFIFGALFTCSEVATSTYLHHKILHHPKSDRLLFLKENYIRYVNYSRSHAPGLDRPILRATLNKWYYLNLRDPLYRNTDEFFELYRTTRDVLIGFNTALEKVDQETYYRNQMKFARFYLWPAIGKIYGVELKSDEDFVRFLVDSQRAWVTQRGVVQPQGQGRGDAEEREWSLKTPEKETEFWEWFEDDRTGKPVVSDTREKAYLKAEDVLKKGMPLGKEAEKREGERN